MTKIIDGKALAQKKIALLASKIQALDKKPCLSIILVGTNEASQIYVNNKIKKAKEIGIEVKLIKLSESISGSELLSHIEICNKNNDVNGIIVQLPLPSHIDNRNIISAIDPSKDVDGFHQINIGMLYSGQEPFFVPCTPLGILDIIKDNFIELSSLHAVIIGRSNIVGRPLASLLLKHDLTVTICHSKTKNLSELTKKADIVISATGQIESLGKEYFSPHSFVIDVGINRKKDGKITGDVKFDELNGFIKALTPVPGGVGPLTIANLMSNTLKAKAGKFYKLSSELME